mmetsp:Transcript_11653/g.32843  ORF Transcript_11653/g.32843 Transcript_11653/m.32843 type:complete len:213 (-) Transcript_11653:335-973(-)
MCVCVTLGGQPRPTPRAAPTQVLPRHSRRLPWSGAPPFPDSVESECGLFVDYVDLLASPGCLAGPTSPIPSLDQSASPSPGRHSAKLRRAAQRQPGACWLVPGQRRTHGHISSPRTTAQCALRPRRAATCRARARMAESGTPLQHAVGIRTGIGARGCVSYTPSNRNNAIPYRYELLNIRPPKFPCAGPSRAFGAAPASQGSIPPESYFALV